MKKIVVIGPESTGKTTLCQSLAQHYNTLWCPEYAREYLIKNGKEYTYDNLLTIAKGQLKLEDEYVEKINKSIPPNTHSSASPLLFIDTDMYVMKVWCEYVFQKCHQFILEQITERKYDLYLLCNTDLAWTQDELREYPDENIRKKLYEIYKDILQNQSTAWVEISGQNDERVQRAIDAVEKIVTPRCTRGYLR
ncbi:MAG: AAA family ATPase [Chitinophagaceae bacterium]|jgi:NadR type nicotinamide-nucleotide adenylyltransferase|nr:AAA family ATPase [Chitinophagaceae bacterium]